MSQIDENRIQVGTAVTDDASLTPAPLLVDPATGCLLVSVTADVLVPTAIAAVKIDQNRIPTYYGVSDADGETLLPIRTDSQGGLLTITP